MFRTIKLISFLPFICSQQTSGQLEEDATQNAEDVSSLWLRIKFSSIKENTILQDKLAELHKSNGN